MTTATDVAELTILFGSQTGNAEYLAHEINETAEGAGTATQLASLEEWMHAGRPPIRRLLVVTSTHDNGHMPDNAAEFWEWLGDLPEGAFEGLPYAVLSIGDSMYDDFCKAGHDIDARLSELGAVRIVDGVDCDVDYEYTAQTWAGPALESLLAAAADVPVSSDGGDLDAAAPDDGSDVVETLTGSGLRTARIVGSRLLSRPGSSKCVMHYELAFDEPFPYEPGDSIAVYVTNAEPLVDEWVAAFGEVDVTWSGVTWPLREVLRREVELRLPHPGLIVGLARRRPDDPAAAVALDLVQSGDRNRLDQWLRERDVLDVVREMGCGDLPVSDILAELRPLQHRDYSIASSPILDDGLVHLTVNGVEYPGPRGSYRGTATAFLSARAEDGAPFLVRRLPAHDFRLPADDVPVIAIGPGVGVAPFRAFLRHRAAVGAAGRTWLFFGDQHRAFDWLYEDDFADLQARGLLSRLDVAFSRDQEQKHYVQHEMLAHADEIREWIRDGASVYVCGDKTHMAPDVDRALAEILAGSDGASDGAAALAALKASARYVKDVY